MDSNIINAAICKYLTIGPTENWHYEEMIIKHFGNNTFDIISGIIKFIYSIQPDWNIESYTQYLDRVEKIIKENYPMLENDAVHVLKNRVAYDWK